MGKPTEMGLAVLAGALGLAFSIFLIETTLSNSLKIQVTLPLTQIMTSRDYPATMLN